MGFFDIFTGKKPPPEPPDGPRGRQHQAQTVALIGRCCERHQPLRLLSVTDGSVAIGRFAQAHRTRFRVSLESRLPNTAAFGPGANCVVFFMDEVQTYTGLASVEQVQEPDGGEGALTLGLSLLSDLLGAEARLTSRIPVVPDVPLRVVLYHEGRPIPFAPRDISLGGIGGFVPNLPDGQVPTGTHLRVELRQGDHSLTLPGEVRMRLPTRPARPGAIGIRFALPRQDGEVQIPPELGQIVQQAEHAWLKARSP